MPDDVKQPKPGEQTKQQPRGADTAGAFGFAFPGFRTPPPGIYSTYRRMRSNPTLALARLVATVPVRASEWSWEIEDGVSDERMEVVQGMLDPLYPTLLKDILYALDYGWQSFEKVWEVKDNKLTLAKLKPLLPDISEILVDKSNGAFRGIKQDKVELDESKALLFTYDGEAGDLYGRSRHENVRAKAWQPWEDILARTGQYATKVASAIPLIRYPEGKSRDASGAEVDNFTISQRVMSNLGKLTGVTMPSNLSPWAEDLARSGVDIEKLWAWQISFIESQGQHGGDLTGMLRHFESLMMRGWLVPERAALEGQHGTKAESEVQQDIVIAGAEVLLDELIDAIQKQVVDQVLVLNWGEEARGTVKLKPSPLVDEKALLMRDMVKQVLTTPANVPLLLHTLDMDSMLDNAGLPKREETIDNEAVLAAWKAGQPAGPFPFPQPGEPNTEAEPAVEPSEPAVETGELETTTETVLNGAQVTAATAIVIAVAKGEIPRDAGVGQLEVLFNLNNEQAERIMGSAGTDTPTTPNPNPRAEADAAAEAERTAQREVPDEPPLAASMTEAFRDLQLLFERTAKGEAA